MLCSFPVLLQVNCSVWCRPTGSSESGSMILRTYCLPGTEPIAAAHFEGDYTACSHISISFGTQTVACDAERCKHALRPALWYYLHCLRLLHQCSHKTGDANLISIPLDCVACTGLEGAFDHVMHHPGRRALLRQFLESRLCTEHLDFYEAATDYKSRIYSLDHVRARD